MITALVDGFRTTLRSWKLIVILYVVTLLLALPAALGLRSVLAGTLGMSLSAPEMLKGFDFMLYDDFMTKHSGRVFALITVGIWSVVVNGFINALLGGGVITVLSGTDRFSLAGFLGAAGRFLRRMVRLFALFLAALGVTVLAGSLLVGASVSALDASAVSEKPLVLGTVAVLTAAWLMIMFIVVWFDLAKIDTVVKDEKRILRSAGRGITFMIKNFVGVAGIQLAMVFVQLLFVGGYLSIEAKVAVDSVGFVVLILLLQQSLIFSRLLGKMWNLASMVALFKERQALPAVEVPPADKPTQSIGVPSPSVPIEPMKMELENPKLTEVVAETVSVADASKSRVPKRRRQPNARKPAVRRRSTKVSRKKS